MRIYDISRAVAEGIPVWPGDTEYRFSLGWQMSVGASVNVGAVTMSVHTGTHVDAPFHFDPDAPGVGEMALAPFVGPAWVVDVSGRESIGPEAFQGVDLRETPRVLLKTGAWPEGTPFPETVPTLTPDACAYLAEQGVILFGIDVPSVDAIDSRTLPNHHDLYRAGIAILESLNLADVPEGRYTLIALPLRLSGADASPVRAILTDYP